MSLTLSLDDLQTFISNFSTDYWIASSDLEIERCKKPPIGVPLSHLLSLDHSFQGLFSTVQAFMSLSDELVRSFEWIWIEGETSIMINMLEHLESNGYQIKIWREVPIETHLTNTLSELSHFNKANCGALLQRLKPKNISCSNLHSFVNYTNEHIDPVKLNRLFESDPFTRAELWHTQDLFEEEQKRQILLDAQKPKRHDPLGIFESEEEPIVVHMTNPFMSSEIPSGSKLK
jgi:hypothetical protein